MLVFPRLFRRHATPSTAQPITEGIRFTPSARELTIGLEIELQLIDPATQGFAPRAYELLAAVKSNPRITPEIFDSMIEINTGICADAHEVNKDAQATLCELSQAADKLGIELSSTGCHPFAHYADCNIMQTERYNDLIDRNRWLTRRWAIFGVHVHLGMKGGDECIRYNNFFVHFLPHLLALSASAPYWQGVDTGLATCRPTIFEAMPTAGVPYRVGNWREFESLCQTLSRAGAIKAFKDLWWDVRPSPIIGTLELRVCDSLANIDETMAIVAFIHALAHWFREHGGWLESMPTPPPWFLRENKWRAIRHGLEASLVINAEGATRPVREDIREWLSRLAPTIEQLGYQAYAARLESMLAGTPAYERQREVFARTGSTQEVVRHNVAELRASLKRQQAAPSSAQPRPPRAANS